MLKNNFIHSLKPSKCTLTCILSSGKCLFYDNYSMSVYLTVVSSVAKLGAVVCFIIALYTSRWCKIPEDFDVDIQVPSRKQTAQEVVGVRKLTRW